MRDIRTTHGTKRFVPERSGFAVKTDFFSGTMAEMTFEQLESCDKKETAVLFPVGVIEEHGPHLPLATDILSSLEECRLIGAELERMGRKYLIAPPYYWGINHCTGGFGGSFSLRPETMRAVLCDILGNLHSFGFDKVYLDNAHGDPVHVSTLLAACWEARRREAPYRSAMPALRQSTPFTRTRFRSYSK